MPRWTIIVDEETDRTIRTHLARSGGKKGDLSKFVTKAARQAAFWQTVDQVRDKNRDMDPAVIEAEVDEAVAEVRTARREGRDADRS